MLHTKTTVWTSTFFSSSFSFPTAPLPFFFIWCNVFLLLISLCHFAGILSIPNLILFLYLSILHTYFYILYVFSLFFVLLYHSTVCLTLLFYILQNTNYSDPNLQNHAKKRSSLTDCSSNLFTVFILTHFALELTRVFLSHMEF